MLRRTLRTRDNIDIVYRVWRQTGNNRPTIVLLHGLGSNHTRWLEFIENTSLTQNWDIVVPDLRGQGESLTRSKITMEIWAQDLTEIMAYEACSQAVFIGHSLGAHLAIFFLNQYKDKVRGLVLIDPLSRDSLTPALRRIWRLRWVGQSLIAIIRFLNGIGLKRRKIPFLDLQKLDSEARKLIADGKEQLMIKRYGSPWQDLVHNPTVNYLQYTYQALRPLPQIDAVRTPVLLLLSGKSAFNEGNSRHALSNEFDNCVIHFVDCNHWLLTEKPTLAQQEIENWFASEFI